MGVAVGGNDVADGIIAVGGTDIGVLVPGTITGTVAVLMGAIAVNWAAAVMAAPESCEPGFFEGRLQAESMRVVTRITETVRGVFFISVLLWKFNINSTASSRVVYPRFLSESKIGAVKTPVLSGTSLISGKFR
jgi:hypothetical protein